MLHTLNVRNLALVESAELQLGPGFHVFSGETGGGKSLLITALKLLSGERATAAMVRHGCTELVVDGVQLAPRMIDHDAQDLASPLEGEGLEPEARDGRRIRGGHCASPPEGGPAILGPRSPSLRR